jgi:membrane associated rhomboid family serine protease
MTTNPTGQPSGNQQVQFEDKPGTPVFTFLMILALLGVFYMAATGRVEPWLSRNCFQEAAVLRIMHQADYGKLVGLIMTSTFASFHILPMALNMYFLWVFAKHTEQKLGPGRFLLLLAIAIFAPWVMGYFDLQRQPNLFEVYFLSPAMMLCTIIGCYMVFPPIPKSKVGAGNIRPRNEIFRRGQRADPLDKYIANPYTFVGVFAGFQIAMHLWITIGCTDLFKPLPGYDMIMPIPALISIALGYGLGQVFLQSATQSFKEGPLTLAALKRYHELIELDVNHDEAIRGTARTLGLPYEKVRDWVQKNKGKLRVK